MPDTLLSLSPMPLVRLPSLESRNVLRSARRVCARQFLSCIYRRNRCLSLFLLHPFSRCSQELGPKICLCPRLVDPRTLIVRISTLARRRGGYHGAGAHFASQT